MTTGLVLWLDSGANNESCHRQVFTWEELGITEASWDAMTEEAQESFARDIAFQQSDWGYAKS